MQKFIFLSYLHYKFQIFFTLYNKTLLIFCEFEKEKKNYKNKKKIEFCQKLQKKGSKKKNRKTSEYNQNTIMKSSDSEIEQLYFYKKLATSNRLESLILNQQEPYPPPQYTVNQIYCSQYATAVHTIMEEGLCMVDDQKSKPPNIIKKQKPKTSSKSRQKLQAQNFIVKYPLPLAFAYFEAYIKDNKLDKAITILSQHLERSNVVNPFVINYNLSYLYRQKNNYKKAIFYVESALKQKPFFVEAVLDYSTLLTSNNRQSQALQMLKRHFRNFNSANSTNFSSLAENPKIQNTFIHLAHKQKKIVQEKQMTRIFNNKQLTLQTSFNLGLYFKKVQSLEKAQKLFQQIIKKLDQCYQNQKNNCNPIQFQQKDQKVYFFSKINLCQIYERIIEKNSRISFLNKTYIHKLRQKNYLLLKSLAQNIEDSTKKFPLFYSKYNDFLKRKFIEAQKSLTQKVQFFSEEKQNETQETVRYSSNDKKAQILTELKKFKSKPILNKHYRISQKTKRNTELSGIAQNQKNQTELIKQFNRKFQQKRVQNEKKLKFLLLKDKELDNFFHNLPKLNFYKNKIQQVNLQSIGQNEQNLNLKNDPSKQAIKTFPRNNQSKSIFMPLQPNNTLINRLRNQLQANNELCKYQQEFQKKKMKYQQQFSGYNIDEAVGNIMAKLFKKQQTLNISQESQKIKAQKNQIDKEKQNEQKKVSKFNPKKTQQKFKIQKRSYQKAKKNEQRNYTWEKQIGKTQINNKLNHQKPFQKQQISKCVKSLKKNEQKKQFKQTKKQKATPDEKRSKTKNSKRQQKITNNKQQKQKNQDSRQDSKQTQSGLKRSNSSSSKNFRIKISVNSIDQQQQQQNVLKNSKQSIIKNILPVENLEQESKRIQVPQIIVNQINQDNLSDKVKTKPSEEQKDFILEDDIQGQPQNILLQNKIVKKESSNISSTSLLSTHKIFVEKQRNNIQDIFEAFNPGTNKNLLINHNAPTSRQQSKKATILKKQTSISNLEAQKAQQATKLPVQFQLKYDQAAELQNQGLYAEAYQIYTQLYKKFKSDELKQMILLGIAYNFELQEQFDQAQKTYLKCSKYNNAEAFMKLGQLLIRQNRIDDGIQNLQKANCITRFNMEIQTKLVYAYSLKEETTEKALSLAQLILKRQPMSLEILIMTAKILQKQQKIAQALQVSLAIDSHKESQYIKHYIGTLYLSQGNVVEAFKYFKNALTLNSNHVPSLIEIGTILSEMKPKQAISILNRALEIQPTNRLALTRLAKIYESIQQDPYQAMEIYRKALQTKSNYQAYMKIADCQSVNGSYLEALMNYREALSLKKTHTVYRRIAEMHEFKKQYKKSVQNYQLALEIIPNENKFFSQKKEIMIQMGKDLLILQQYDPAIATLEKLLENEESKEIYDILGQAYFGKQQYSIALQYYEKANNIETDKEDVQLLEKIALCFDRKQQFTASRKIYQKILSVTPTNISCINNYANILLILGETNEAFYWYEVMLQNAPKNLEKRLKVADIYSAVGDWSKVEYHLLLCYKIKQHDTRVLQKLINLYKEKRENKLVAKYEKKLALMKGSSKKKQL